MKNPIFNKPVLLASVLAVLSTQSNAEMVTLSDLSGTNSVHGDLIGYDGTEYILRTSIGDLALRADQSICDGAGCPAILSEVTNLRVAGSGTVTEHLIPELAEAYFGEFSAGTLRDESTGERTYFEFDRLNNSDLMMTLVHSNSTSGFSNLIDGELHAAFTTRPANAAEMASAAATAIGTIRSEGQESVIAHDGLLVITHPANPIRAMSEMDISRLFSGEVTDWSSFGHDGGVINVYVRESDSNSRDMLDEVLLAPNRQSLTTNVIVMQSDMAIADAVKADTAGIGLTSFVHRTGVNALEIEGVCGIRVPATRFTIKTGEYPLSRPIYFYHNQSTEHEGLAGFADFVASGDAQPIIRAAGFVDRQISSEPLNAQGLRVSNAIMGDEAAENMIGTRSMLQLMSHAERLSTTVRFDPGSTDLDPTDYQDLELLAAYMQSPENDGANFYFMGFSDSIGRADLNQFVAVQRAEIVRQALVSRYPNLAERIVARSIGYGELSPLACNETRPGRIINRRVEVWIEKPMAMASQ